MAVAMACGWAGGAAAAAPSASPLESRLEALIARSDREPEKAAAELRTMVQEASPRDVPCVVSSLWLVLHDLRLPDEQDKLLERLDQRDDASAKVAAAMMRAWRDPHTVSRSHRLTQVLPLLDKDVCELNVYRTLSMLSGTAHEAGRFDEAVRYAIQTVAAADRLGTPRRKALARSNLAWIYRATQQWAEARELNDQAIAYALQEGSPSTLSQVYNTEAFIHAESGRTAEGFEAMKLALKAAAQSSDPEALPLQLANSADLYLRVGDYAEAQAQSERALVRSRELHFDDGIALALANRGLARLMLKQTAAGLADLKESLAMNERAGQHAMQVSQMQEFAGYLERAGDTTRALDYYLRSRPLADKLYSTEQQQALLELQSEFDRTERQRALRLLEEEHHLQEARGEAQTLRTRTWVAASVAAVLAASLMVVLARRTRRANDQLAEVNAELQVQSERDPLTGLANRRRLMQVMANSPNEGHWEGSLMLIDLDHFKRINDHYGHAAGDTVLVEVARRLTEAVRPLDLVVRWGGEEFLVVAQTRSMAEAEALAERLLQALATNPVLHEAMALPVTGSIGFASFPLGPTQLSLPWERAIDLIDTALYLAKAHGRNRAYGIHTLEVTTPDDVAAVASSLEEAWRAVRVQLTQLQGPTPVAATALQDKPEGAPT